MLTKIVSNSLKTTESYKTRQDAFDKTCIFWEFFVSFWTIFRKFENAQKILGKWFRTNKFMKNNFQNTVANSL